MANNARKKLDRVFKTAWFSKAAGKARVSDDELCTAIRQVRLGQADDLGGGVFKKRLDRNRHRSIILAKGGQYWVYEYLFAKKDKANIGIGELAGLRRIAKAYEELTEHQVVRFPQNGSWMEICNEDEPQVQE